MGNKESKSLIISYDDALKRVSEDEFKRLQEAFKRYSSPGGYMSKAIFIRDVFGEGMPQKLGEYEPGKVETNKRRIEGGTLRKRALHYYAINFARYFLQHLFYAFGGSNKGIGFKELFSGLVLLTKGTQTEKLRFIFSIIAHHEDGYYVARVDIETFIAACDGSPPPSDLAQLFKNDPRVSYEQFCSWLLRNSHVMKLSAWLLEDGGRKGLRLSDESDTPTFYQTLAGVTHLEEADIIELEKRYWTLQAQSKTGRLDLDTLRPLISPPLPSDLVQGLFNAFDENKDSHIDLKEMACGLSACCRGPKAERLKFCFKIFDFDRDGLLSRTELENMCKSLLSVRTESRDNQEIDLNEVESLDPIEIAGDILTAHDEDQDGFITAEEFQVWAVKNSLPDDFSKLLFQICHIVLGLRPATNAEEKEVILGWVDREKRRGMKAAQTWYLIAADWWQSWLKYVSYKPSVTIGKENQSTSNTGTQTNMSAMTPNHHSGSSPGHSAWSENSSTQKSYSTLPANFRKKGDGSIHPLPPPNGAISGSPKKKAGRSAGKDDTLLGPAKPGPINNTVLILPDSKKQVPSLTNEGGRLRRQPPLNLSKDYETLPDPVWKALFLWYAGGPALPRNVIIPDPQNPVATLERYPIHVKLLRHQTQQNKNGWNGVNINIGGLSLGGNQLGNLLNSSSNTATPKKYLANTACFSKLHTVQQVHEFLAQRLRIPSEEMRLWNSKDESNPVLIEEDSATMQQLGIVEDQSILIEIRNKDLSWPEEMSLLAKNKQDKYKQVISEGGVTGLSNLGNTCFMNAAVQCISNTQPLTLYFKTEAYLFELNTSNRDGMKGHIARRYGELVTDLWSGTAKSIAPLKLRWTIAKYSLRFNDFQQHDSQELLAFLLDGLHEDLNRVQQKKYVELKDSDGRPDEEVALEAWDNHLVRNQSIVVDLFQGLLKSQVRCKHCGNVSVRFDPFTFLSLPLPMESSMHVEIIVVRLDGSVPLKYGLRLNLDDKYKTLKRELAELCDLSAEQLLLVEIAGAMVRSFPQDNQKVRNFVGGILYAYEIPIVGDEDPKATDGETEVRLTTAAQEASASLPPVDDVAKEMPQSNPAKQTHAPVPTGITVTDTSTNQSDSSASSAKSSASTTPSQDSASTSGEKPFGSNVLSKPNHVRSPSNVSVASSVTSGQTTLGFGNMEGLVVAMHRKQIRMDMYFLAWQKARPCLFSTPLILPASANTHRSDLYKATWTHVARLVVATGSPESSGHIHNRNHAEDGIQAKGPASSESRDSPQQKYPFTLKMVQKDGLNCALCPWYRFCRGCDIPCTEEPVGPGVAFIAVEWDPTALHLRYQASQERAFVEHESVEKSRRMQTEPIDLDDCLRAFTKEEELGEDEKYYCSKCKEHRLAAKKLDIWRLPPILIIHLKRFQFVNGRWVKSQKIVKCPEDKFNLSNFVAPRAKEANLTAPLVNGDVDEGRVSEADTNQVLSMNSIDVDSVQRECKDEESCEVEDGTKSITSLRSSDVDPSEKYILHEEDSGDVVRTKRKGSEEEILLHAGKEGGIEEGSINGGMVRDESFSDGDFPQKEKLKSVSSLSDPVDASNSHPLISDGLDPETGDRKGTDEYNLYAVVCHTGILGGGHYVSYAVNPNKRWYSYNDSSVKEVKSSIDLDHAYMLFYERTDLDYSKYIPHHKGTKPDLPPIDDEIEDNFRKLCVIQ